MFCWQSCLVGRWGECYLVEQVFLLLCKFTVICSVHACMFANILHRIILMLKLRLISEWPWCPAYWPRCPLIIFESQGQLALPSNCPNSRPGGVSSRGCMWCILQGLYVMYPPGVVCDVSSRGCMWCILQGLYVMYPPVVVCDVSTRGSICDVSSRGCMWCILQWLYVMYPPGVVCDVSSRGCMWCIHQGLYVVYPPGVVCAVSCCCMQKEPVPHDYDQCDPEHKTIYRFIRMLFNAAQLTAECAIVTLVSST